MALISKFTRRKAQSEMRKNKNGNGIQWVAALLPLCVAVSIPLTANAQTQTEMNITAGKAYDRADKTMTVAYKKLMTVLTAKQKKQLKAAQVAWIKFRDAETVMLSGQVEGGSVYPLVFNTNLKEITERRTKELKDAYSAFTDKGRD